MSGEHFVDNGQVISQFAYELEAEIGDGCSKKYSSEVIEYLEEQVHYLYKMADVMYHIDRLFSGDHSEDSFMERVKEVEEKYGT